jgi:ATP-dependent helicase/nuclease subunit A
MESQLTSQQDAAVNRRGVSVILASGAGCGKTHVLTERYLSHLRDDYAEVNQLVAITFTDRAARQMRDRIRRAILNELHQAANDADAERWSRHLRALETAQISTIHAFCGNILRANAIEVGLDPAFDVLEDVLATNLESEAITDSLQGLLTAQGDAGPDLRELVLLYGWGPTVEAVRSLVRAWDAEHWSEWLAEPAEAVAERWQTTERGRLQAGAIEHVVATSPRIAHCLNLLRTNECIGPIMKANVAIVLTETPELRNSTDLAAAVEHVTEAAKVGKERGKAWKSEEIYERIRDAMTEFREELRTKLAAFTNPPGDVLPGVEVGRRFLRVADAAARAYRLRKRRAAVVDFQDLLVLARDLLRDSTLVRTQLQNRYRFLLIDELQDTDPVQMELVESLTGAGLTGGKLFAVGDHKQSIYRFRGADVQLFQKLREQVPPEGRLNLSLNFRSQPAILDFTNALLSTRLVDYQPLEAYHAQVNPGPCVELLWSACDDRDTVAEQRAAEAEGIALRIAQMVRGETLVRQDGQLRPVTCGDIVLLFRAMSNVHLYESALRKHGLDYYLVGGRAFFAQQEIYDLLNLLRCLENPQDAVCLAGTLRSPFCCLSDEALFLLSSHREGLWAGLHDDGSFERLPDDQRPTAERARQSLDRWRGLKDRLPIARLLGEVFADSGYDAATQFEFLGDRKLANLWKLLDLARTFDRSGLFGLAEFIQRLGDLVKTQPREEQAATQPESADVVRLMTIHQAKGLEFPVVFIPDIGATPGGAHLPVAVWDGRLGCVARPPLDEEPLPFSEFGWSLYRTSEDVADWHEELRTLYVACTRAEDYLVLSASRPEPFQPKNTWMLTLAERFNLETGACLEETPPPERRPQVRVTRAEEIPAVAYTPAPPVLRAQLMSSAAIAPVSVEIHVGDVIALEGLEAYLREPAAPLPLDLLAPQFDAEDGADRATWVFPSQRESSCRTGLQTRPDGALLRTALAFWDFRDADAWQNALTRALADAGDVPRKVTEVCGERLERFSRSAVFGQFTSAAVCRQHVPFLLDWPLGTWKEGTRGKKEKRKAPELFETPSIRIAGTIDCLWQDAEEAWHLLRFLFSDASEKRVHARFSEASLNESVSLSVASWVVQQQTGLWPTTLTVYSFDTGTEEMVRGQRFGFAKHLAIVEQGLTALLHGHSRSR